MNIVHVSVYREGTVPPDGLVSKEKQVLAIGDFDGLHLGHQEVLKRALQTAKNRGCTASVMTFHPHPREVLGQEIYAVSLTPLEDKLERMANLGLERAYVVKFDKEFAMMSPEHFVESVLIPLQVETVVIGFDFRFGHGGEGDADTLSSLAKGRFAVEVVRPYHRSGDKVSSTLIRECLQQGDVQHAAELLGRPYSIRGDVVTGEGRGRTIGIPTANLSPSEPYVIPARGVYVVRVHVDGQAYYGVMNIGLKPTFGGLTETLEAHLFDFNEMIYGRRITIECLRYIRQERKFSSAAELVAQIQSDMQQARDYAASLS